MIKDLKSLKSLLKICRDQGVSEITLEGLSIKFGDMPKEQSAAQPETPSDELTDEQLMFYSVEGTP